MVYGVPLQCARACRSPSPPPPVRADRKENRGTTGASQAHSRKGVPTGLSGSLRCCQVGTRGGRRVKAGRVDQPWSGGRELKRTEPEGCKGKGRDSGGVV